MFKGKIVKANNLMQKKYKYKLEEPMGKNFDVEFKPDLTPKQMLGLGIFGGKYLNSAVDEYPSDWFLNAKLSNKKNKNYFGVNASQSISVWRNKGWISKYDPRGWFEWYCRYYMGRRIPDEDARQIRRWRQMKRHCAQVANNCRACDIYCRPKQRQALLHWAYDSRKI